MSHPGESQSIWMKTLEMPKFPKLEMNASVDVCVIGGGIAGLTTAYTLAQEGKSVCLLEAFELASGQTAHTTAHFSNAFDDRYYVLERLHGQKGARLAAESHTAAIAKVQEIVAHENILCDVAILDGYLFAKDDRTPNILENELAAVHRAGLGDVTLVEKAPLTSFDTGPALKFPHQLQLHPLKYLRGLVSCLCAKEGKENAVAFYTHTKAVAIESVADGSIVTTADGFNVLCKFVVVAANTPFNDRFAIHTKQAPYRTYVVGYKIRKGFVPQALYWDTLDPYHYIRVQPLSETEDLLIIGGEDHKTGQEDHPEDRYAALHQWARERFSIAGEPSVMAEPIMRWSGQVMEPVDHLAYLGHNPADRDNVYVITGDSGQGMTHATIGAMIITDQIMGRSNTWEKLYDPSRLAIHAPLTYLQENANVALQYADWLTIKSDAELEELRVGEGLVYRDGLAPIAAYKNEDGVVEEMSAVCPHLAGIVRWNSTEKSWDCPCHGSRFDCHGEVIEGPANQDLTHFAKERSVERSTQPSAFDISFLKENG